MNNASPLDVSQRQATPVAPASTAFEQVPDQQLCRWGANAGIAGVISMILTVGVVVTLGLPDASDVETLRDFDDIEAGRIFEHFFYLGALILFALHEVVLHRVLKIAHPPAALFGTVVAAFGLVVMAASSLLHVSTAPLSELYTASDTPPQDLLAIEYAWHGAQSVFDTMLATGVLLVPIGIVLYGVAMRSAPAYGSRLAALTIVLGILGVIGAALEIVVPGSGFSAASVLVIVVFHAGSGWRMRRLGDEVGADRTDRESAAVG